MPDFAINPPVHLGRPEVIVRFVEHAVDFVRNCGVGSVDRAISGLLGKPHGVQFPEQAQDAGPAFKTWLERRDLSPVPPDAP